MSRRYLSFIVLLTGILFASSTWAARPDKSWKKWFGHFAGGYTAVTGEAADYLDAGWNINGGATYWPETWPVGLVAELGYNNLSIDDKVLALFNQANTGANVTSGDASAWTLTADFIWSPSTSGTVGVNILGGVGGYYLGYDLGEPAVFTGVSCPPWGWGWGWCFPVSGVGTATVQSDSTTRFGYNLGAAITFNVGLGSQLFVEAKYHRVETSRAVTELIPIVVGYRW